MNTTTPVVSAIGARLLGLDGELVKVTVALTADHGGFVIEPSKAGLPPLRELHDRLRAAFLTCSLRWPSGIALSTTVPDHRHWSSTLDLAVAVAILAADGQAAVPCLDSTVLVGQLSLDGQIIETPGTLILVEAALSAGLDVIAASRAASEACGLLGHGPRRIWPADHLNEVIDILASAGNSARATAGADRSVPARPELLQGSALLREALVVAAGGAHHLLGVVDHSRGVDDLAQVSHLVTQVVHLLPDLGFDAVREVARIYSATGEALPAGNRPPLRHVDHEMSAVRVVGGATANVAPGELSLGHHGVVVAHDLSLISTQILDNLIAPLDHGTIRVSRAGLTVDLPARILLAATIAACSCRRTPCTCSPAARTRYRRRRSGPVFDHFDLMVPLDTPTAGMEAEWFEPLADAAMRVLDARARAAHRGVDANAHLTADQLAELAPLSPDGEAALESAKAAGHLTDRGRASVHRVAVTVADLADEEPPISQDHVETALALRRGAP